MSVSGPFIVRSIGTSLLMFAILLAGILSYQLLPVASLPQVEYPTIQVLTNYPGASPDVMATSVTAPLERQFGQMPGLNQMTSTSSSTTSVIVLQFALELPLDVAEQEVQAAINAATTYLPADLPVPPIYNKVNPADSPVLTIALTSKTQPLYKVEDFAETRLGQKISQQPGVGLVTVNGGQRPAVRIQANPDALSSYGLSLEALRTAIAAANVNAAKGSFDGPQLAYTINANDQLLSADDYRPLVIAYKNNAPVRLSDVANVIDGAENTDLAAWMNTEPSIILNIQRQPGANVIAVVDHIKQLLPLLRHLLPQDIQLTILNDSTTTIRTSVHNVQMELLLSVFLVVAVIFVFLRNVSATIIPSISVPLSLVGTFAAMYLLGFSLNNLTLMALTIAAGFVVDDAIVMIENIARFLEQGNTPFKAAIKGAEQIAFTIISLTLSLIGVLIPLLFMGDIIGRLFREFAVTLSVTILISAFVSLTLTPMLCSRLLRPTDESKMNWFGRHAKNVLDGIIHQYQISLQWVLQHQPFILLTALATFLVTCILFIAIPKGFFPTEDTGVIQGFSVMSQSISFPAMASRQQELARIILNDPAVENISSFIGIDNTNPTLNTGRMLITLKPLDARDVTATEVIQRLQSKLADVPDAAFYMQPVQDLSIDTRVSATQYQYSIGSPNADEVNAWTKKLLDRFQNSETMQDVASNQQNNGLQTAITIDRDTSSRLGITPQLIDDTLYDAFGQRQISTIYTQRNQYHVILEALPALRQQPASLDNIYINSTTGGAVPLRAITHAEQQSNPLVIYRQDQFPVSIISFNLAPNASLGDAVSAVEKMVSEFNIPQSVVTSFEGSAKTFQSSLHNEGWLIVAAIIVVYIILGVLYESYIHPITILSTLPSACMGALLALMLTGNELSVIALIGIILLIGIVLKNAILMIDFALEQERRYKKPPEAAIYEAALLRFRPILMTTMAAMLGAVPLAFGSGVGSELRQPLGIAIIGGLIVSQLLTLYTTPVIYLAFDRLSRRVMAIGVKPNSEQP